MTLCFVQLYLYTQQQLCKIEVPRDRYLIDGFRRHRITLPRLIPANERVSLKHPTVFFIFSSTSTSTSTSIIHLHLYSHLPRVPHGTTNKHAITTMSSPSKSPSSKLAQPEANTSLPELPWAFIDCSIDILIKLLSHMLELLIKHNDQVVLTPESLTRFHSRAAPGISVVDYLARIVKYTNCEVSFLFVRVHVGFIQADTGVENTVIINSQLYRHNLRQPPYIHSFFPYSSPFPHCVRLCW